MYHLLFCLSILLWVSCDGASQIKAPVAQDVEPTTVMSYAQADRQLNDVYTQILASYASDHLFVTKLKSAQRIWISFRDAEIEMRYPAEDKQLEYGSVYATCRESLLAAMTIQRVQQLNLWLEGIEEGDVCAGSVHRKE